MKDKNEHLKFDDDSETKRRSREIEILINVIEPDPELQPYFLSDQATVFEVSAESEEAIRKRMEAYLGAPLKFSLRQPLWQVVDEIKKTFPQWPNDWPPLVH
jgi:hypothetical protein